MPALRSHLCSAVFALTCCAAAAHAAHLDLAVARRGEEEVMAAAQLGLRF
jgi:hypothetical protein